MLRLHKENIFQFICISPFTYIYINTQCKVCCAPNLFTVPLVNGLFITVVMHVTKTLLFWFHMFFHWAIISINVSCTSSCLQKYIFVMI